jgi:hypothetical protein
MRGYGLVVVAGRQVMQDNDREVVMAAADERQRHTRAEARTTTADERGWQWHMREDGGGGD